MTKLRRTTLAMLLGACLATAGCGSNEEGDPIPVDRAAVLQTQLDNVQDRLDNGSVGACDDILEGPRGPNVIAVRQAVAALPDRVDADLRSALQDGFDRLWELVEERCDELREEAEARQQETETAEEPPVVTETEPPETETETQPETETVPPEQTETLPPVETETVPPQTEAPAPPAEDDESGGVPAPEGDEG